MPSPFIACRHSPHVISIHHASLHLALAQRSAIERDAANCYCASILCVLVTHASILPRQSPLGRTVPLAIPQPSSSHFVAAAPPSPLTQHAHASRRPSRQSSSTLSSSLATTMRSRTPACLSRHRAKWSAAQQNALDPMVLTGTDARRRATPEPRFCLQATGPAEDVAGSPRPRSTSTGAAAVDHKARQDSVDGGAREHTTGDAGARHAQEIARTRARGRAVSSAHRGQWRMRVRRTTSSRQHPTRVKETTTGTASAPPEERDSDAQGGDCRARRRPRAASVRPSILCTPSAASNAPAPDAQPDLRESSHTTRVGTPSVPLFPLASPAVRRPTTAPVRLHPPAAAAGASEQRPGHESSAVSGAVDRSHIARAAKLRLTHNATDRVQQRMISRTFALPALCVR
ncbi:hypothetical protein POSPLADRAFT_1063432 [Postia placenta MAD-698-R-SB12]|uniref:Uncharacterized protein n=1 Tax=Postia placenta MAD-698-R-SB12 TaxID=670580 RepID=A0A1X6MHE0_9APHY|nr:hypothetical protein POSPLADRAFT_1063432 [Postia placenta MAD-698-R-SB12]OSX55841.1 hypothetical protein POSPLADRAFT_1063432 [Postia placenta MAD-698-R-SB12]